MAPLIRLFVSSFICYLLVTVSDANFNEDVDIIWGESNVKISEDGGKDMSLTINKASGSGFQTKKEYLFARFDIELKLVPDYSAGIVTTFYLTSMGESHDEIDMEFLGNVTGEPLTLHTNVFAEGKGNRERQFNLWFDPAKEYHKYSIIWNPERIIFMIDDKAIRVHDRYPGSSFPTKQPMRVIATIWNGDQWATQKGKVKVDWSKAPFTAHYRNLKITEYKQGDNIQTLTRLDRNNIRWVEKKHMVYDYCPFFKKQPECRFRLGRPAIKRYII